MKHNPSFVFDTNVIISALLFADSIPGRAFFYALDHGKILLSLPILEELTEVLGRNKFDSYIDNEDRASFLFALLKEAVFIETTEKINICRDEKDNKFIELAISGNASCIISGDNDLLVLKEFRGIPILRAEEFLSWAEDENK